MRLFIRILKYSKPYLFHLLFGFGLMILLAQQSLLMPLFQQFVIDDILFHAKEPLASIDLAFQGDLESGGEVSNALRAQLEGKGILLSSDTAVSIEEAGRKWRITDAGNEQKYIVGRRTFQIKSDYQSDLEASGVISADLRKHLKDKGIQLSPGATVSVEAEPGTWLIVDGEKHYVIWQEDRKLKGHEGELKIYRSGVTHTFLGREFTYSAFGWLAIILCTIFIVFASCAIFTGVRTYVMEWVSMRVRFDIRTHVFSHLQKLSMRFYDVQGTGQILSRVKEDVSALSRLVTDTTLNIVTDVIAIIVMLAIMFTWSWKLSLVALIALPLITGNYFYFIGKKRRLWRILRHKWADITTTLTEAIAGAKVVKAFHRERYQERRVFRYIRQTLGLQLKVTKYRAYGMNIAMFCRMLGKGMVLTYGAYLVTQNELTIGTLIAFYQFVERLYKPVMELLQVNMMIQHAMVSVERVFGLLDSKPGVEEAPDAVDLPEIQGHVQFENVSFSYDPENPVLHNVNIEAKPNMMVALVGPSGCGKSTISNLIERFYDPTEGAVRIDGHDLRDVTLKSLRDQMGVVLQDNFLFEGTIGENIRFGRLNATDEEVVQAAVDANAHKFIVEQLPDGYETEVGERGLRLSGGQKQRIAIARTILRDPRVLILDEATSALDSESEAQIQQALDRLMEGRTSFVIAHRLSTILKADTIVAMKEGRIVEMGTHKELVAAGGIYAGMYKKQFKIEQEAASQGEKPLEGKTKNHEKKSATAAMGGFGDFQFDGLLVYADCSK